MRFALSRMNWQRQVIAVVLSIVATTASAKEKHLIIVLAEPTADTFELGADVTVKLTITYNGDGGMMSFQTCSDLYSVEVKDSEGMPVPKHVSTPPLERDSELTPPPDLTLTNLPLCARDILVTLKPGESWHDTISLGQYVELKSPGTFTGRIIWLSDKTAVGEIPSNCFRFTIRAKQKS